jgi:hypothetical protein
MKEISQVTCLILDTGLFLPMAFRMAEACKRVIFAQVSEKTPATIKSNCIGDGFEQIESVRDFWPLIDEVDLVCFPDSHHSGLQQHLESMGKAVWGCRKADVMELARGQFMKMLEDLGLDVPVYETVNGLAELREHLSDKTDKYIKISRFRGDMETFHWRDRAHDDGWLDWLAVSFGPMQNHMRFLVFDKIDTELELGGDTYCIDGTWPSLMLNGLEWKDKSYFGALTKRQEAPEQTLSVMQAFSPFLAKNKYLQFWSMEVRVKDDKSYFIDATVRAGLPSSASQQLLWKNYPEIVWAGANGELVEPEPEAQFTIETMVTTKAEKDSWDTVELPEELKRNCRFSSCAFVDGRYCFPPDDLHTGDLGWLCALGNTPQETLDEIKRLADLLPDGLDAKVEDLAGVLKEIDTAEKEGIPITDSPVPDPAAAIE